MGVVLASVVNNMPDGRGQAQSGELDRESHVHRDQGMGNSSYQILTKCSTVEFPKFLGDDLRGWVYRCEQFFEVDATPSESKVKLAAVHLEGKALQWHQMLMKSRLIRNLPNWEEYVRALNERFGTFVYEDPMAELVNLKQTGTIQEYLDKFDELMNCVDLSEQYAISCFLGELYMRFQSMRLNPQELDDKRARGLCFWCDEKFISNRQCTKKRQIYLMELLEGEDEEITKEQELIEQTVKEKGVNAAKKWGCKLENATLFPVAVADGNKVYSSHICRDFNWKMQGVEFKADMLILLLGGCDAVLGVQWLITLGDIS
ncbi:hypothetical protein BUALT_Bualt06G0022400 [Buddleja alternifolia]|uniref:Retrotransposon gag domain-containing protein n=1 Tax=Buddleja alternifolia TaxID=168488 RepID=A0AAV6XDD8_9LAMI|nr:hypothetical protein BUALT_Bualt06G0022400 [Buddleja alternifolia]